MDKKLKWIEVQDAFSEEDRHYNNKYLEVDYVLNNQIEVSYFTGEQDEIYINFDPMFGVIYVDRDKAIKVIEKVKKEFEEEYLKHNRASGDFINYFCEKYKVDIPQDIFSALTFDEMIKLMHKYFPM